MTQEKLPHRKELCLQSETEQANACPVSVFRPCYNAILNTAFFTLPTPPDRTQGLCASPGRSMTSSPACRSNRDALPSFQNRISALGSYLVSGVGSGCSVTQICSFPCRIHWISAYLLCVSKRQSPCRTLSRTPGC